MPALMTVLEQVRNPRGQWDRVRRPEWRPVPLRSTVRIGRDSAVEIGADPEDRRVSGRAVELSHDGERWQVTAVNRHGVDLYRWGQAPRPMTIRETEPVIWPRVALYIRGNESTYRHWVLCDDPGMPSILGGDRTSTDTEPGNPPPALTDNERIAVLVVFAELLAWPPRCTARPRTMLAAGKHLGVSESAIRRRLETVRRKATALGAPGNAIDDPTYVYTLVGHGYLRPESAVERPAV
jgi:hypothetical protein